MNKKPSKKKSPKLSKSKTESVSKYFKNDKSLLDTVNKLEDEPKSNKHIGNKTVFYDSADGDFRSPVVLRKRNDTAWKLTKDTTQKSKSKRAGSKKGITSTIQIIKENFQSTGENPEHLQMAIALSKSAYEAEYGHSSEATIKEETPDISGILQNAKLTNLERFGFKAGKPVATFKSHSASSEHPKRLKNRFKYITPILNIRSTEDRESLIAAKISRILSQSNPNPKNRPKQSLISSRLQDYTPKNSAIFQVDNIYETNYFYKDNLNLPKNDYKCGCLLKDWNSIPGRDKSPTRNKVAMEYEERATSDKNNSQPDNENVLKNINSQHGTGEKCSSQQLSLKNNSEKMVFEENPLFSVNTWTDTKDSGLTSLGPQTFSSISSSYRSISPDLFSSDDEQYYDVLNKADELKHSEASSSFTETYNSLSDKKSSTNTKVGSSAKEFQTEVIDLTDDNIESGNKNKNNCSFIRLASFYTLDEFEEDIGSDKDNFGFNTGELNTNEEMNEDNHVKNYENINYIESSEEHMCNVPKNSSLTSFHKSPPLNDLLTMREDSCSYENLEEDHANLCSSKDPFNTPNLNNCDPVDIENGKNVSRNAEDLLIKCHASEHVSFFKNNHSVCIQTLDASLPDHLLADVKTLSLALDGGQNPKTSQINDLTKPEETSVSNDLINKEHLTIYDAVQITNPLKDPQSDSVRIEKSIICFDISDDSLPDQHFQIIDKLSNNPILEENDSTNSKLSSRLSVLDNCAINNISQGKHFDNNANIDRSRKRSPRLDCESQLESNSADQMLDTNMSYKDDESSCFIEILDDSFSDHPFEENARNLCKSEELLQRETLSNSGASAYVTEKESDNYSMNNASKNDSACDPISSKCVQTGDENEEREARHFITPVKTRRLSSIRNSLAYNSADLNVTDYVNNLLNQENFSFDICDEEIASNENEEMLSQSSQGSVVVDEELNYSSNFETSSKFPTQTHVSPNDLDMVAVDNLSDDVVEFPVIQTNISLSQPKKPTVVNTEATISNKVISTPDNYIVKTKDITPMPDYDIMTTPLINKELKKVGVKPLKRTRGAKLLKYIYESTHPLADVVEVLEKTDSEGEERAIKRRKKCKTASNIETSVNLTYSTFDIEPVSSIEIIGSCIIENEKPEDLIFERKKSVRVLSCQVPLQIVWHNFLSCNPTIKENVLLYEPLQLESLHMMLKEQGFKFHIQDLLSFLDKKCITIRTAQKQRKRHR